MQLALLYESCIVAAILPNYYHIFALF